MVQETYQAVKTVSIVAREAGITASQLFQWRKAYADCSLVAVGSKELVVPASEMKEALKRIKQLEATLGRKMLENEIFKEAVEYGKSRKWIAHSPLLPGATSKRGLFCSWRFAQPHDRSENQKS